jgi:hypothetical protein
VSRWLQGTNSKKKKLKKQRQGGCKAQILGEGGSNLYSDFFCGNRALTFVFLTIGSGAKGAATGGKAVAGAGNAGVGIAGGGNSGGNRAASAGSAVAAVRTTSVVDASAAGCNSQMSFIS